MKTWMMIIAGLIALSANAQTRRDTPSKTEQQSGITVVGNGGDVVDCGDKEPLLLLDVYEMRLINKNASLRITGKTVEEKINNILDRVAKVSKYQSKIVKEALEQYANNSTPERDLIDIPDSQHIFFPEGCQVRQIVIQQRVNGISHFKVDPDLLNRLDDDNKVYLAFHEAVYAEAIDLGQKNSIATRALNRFMSIPNGGYIRELMKTRAALGFTVFEEMKNGDVAILKPSEYNRVYDRYGYKIGGRKSFQAKSVLLSNGTHINATHDGGLIVTNTEDGIKILEGTDLDPKYFHLPPSIRDISKIDFEKHIVISKSATVVQFDGHNYTCEANLPLPIETGKIKFCKGNTDSQTLPVHFTKRLLNNSKSYKITFHYNENQPSGIKFENLDTIWHMGFTPREDLYFKAYEEDWTTQHLSLDLKFETDKRNSIKIVGNSSAVECELFSGETVFSMKSAFPNILEGHVWFSPKDNPQKNIIEYTGCSIPTNYTSYRLEKFKRDENGNLLSGEFTQDAQVSFAGSTTRVKDPVFKNNQIVSALLMDSAKAYYKGKYRGLIPGLVYNISNNGVEMVLNPEKISKTPQGWLETKPRANWGYKASMIATLATAGGDSEAQVNIYEHAIFTEDLVLLQGTLLEPTKLPVCEMDRETEKIKVTVRTVGKWFEIKSRRMTNPEGDLCYWIQDKSRK